MAHQFNKDIAYIENSDNPNTLNIIPVSNAGKCMTLDGTKEWNYNNALAPGSKWVEKTSGGDMLKSFYDANNDNIVNVSHNSERLGYQYPPYYLNRDNHTGTQSMSTILNLDVALADKQSIIQGLGVVLTNTSLSIPANSFEYLRGGSTEDTTVPLDLFTRTGSPLILLNAPFTSKKYRITASISFRPNVSGDFTFRFFNIGTNSAVFSQKATVSANSFQSISFTWINSIGGGHQYTFDIGGANVASTVSGISGYVLIESCNF
jgi:hypothetical protein